MYGQWLTDIKEYTPMRYVLKEATLAAGTKYNIKIPLLRNPKAKD